MDSDDDDDLYWHSLYPRRKHVPRKEPYTGRLKLRVNNMTPAPEMINEPIAKKPRLLKESNTTIAGSAPASAAFPSSAEEKASTSGKPTEANISAIAGSAPASAAFPSSAEEKASTSGKPTAAGKKISNKDAWNELILKMRSNDNANKPVKLASKAGKLASKQVKPVKPNTKLAQALLGEEVQLAATAASTTNRTGLNKNKTWQYPVNKRIGGPIATAKSDCAQEGCELLEVLKFEPSDAQTDDGNGSFGDGGITIELPSVKTATLPSEVAEKLEAKEPTTSVGATNVVPAAYKKIRDKIVWEDLIQRMRANAEAKNSAKPAPKPLTPPKAAQALPGEEVPPDAMVASTLKGSAWNTNKKRQCPFYKKIRGTSFAVDAFSYGVIPGISAYFLTHFHADHYVGLKASFEMPLYCTSVTASLVQANIRVKKEFLHVLALNEPRNIGGVMVTALDANHCPGSAMLLFRLPDGTNVLHVGDFRATIAMESLPELSGLRISQLHLDTTYCTPEYNFPTQEDAVAAAIDIVKSHLQMHPRTLIVCGTYLIGKEKLFVGVAKGINCRIWATKPKAKILRLLEDKAITNLLVSNPLEAKVHILAMQQLNFESLERYLEKHSKKFTNVLALRPTGWVHSRRSSVTTKENVTIAGVPYSEHSSFSELARFVKSVRPESIVPTVNVGSAESRLNMKKHFSIWLPYLR